MTGAPAHTPGPWSAERMPDGAYTVTRRFRDDRNRRAVTFVGQAFVPSPGNEDNLGTAMANGRLMAAAPAMLAALRDVLGAAGRFDRPDVLAAVEAAVMKAEGRE